MVQTAAQTTKVVKKARTAANKVSAFKAYEDGKVFEDGKTWIVRHGALRAKPKKGRPAAKTEHLFRVVGEKIPFAALADVKAHYFEKIGQKAQGVYIAHDSMGCPRYIGRGAIFNRLEARFKAQPLELVYFSFYVVADKKHEREIETLMIRAAGFLLEFNTKKKRVGVAPGNVLDYEAGTFFYERRLKKGSATPVKKPKAVKS